MEETEERDVFLEKNGLFDVMYLSHETKWLFLLSVMDRVDCAMSTDTFVHAIAFRMLDGGIAGYMRMNLISVEESIDRFLSLDFRHRYELTVITVASTGVDLKTHDNWKRYIVKMSNDTIYVEALSHVLHSMFCRAQIHANHVGFRLPLPSRFDCVHEQTLDSPTTV
jgi:hypothetical protein